ncbi:hypothetical protein HRbin02_01014 [Candidatus Calditenuaceae archaeon HR02]|nr:hypothetical protein HRbin02_01014 [Candidatus Calditenuaceae archaeon HR02]
MLGSIREVVEVREKGVKSGGEGLDGPPWRHPGNNLTFIWNAGAKPIRKRKKRG